MEYWIIAEENGCYSDNVEVDGGFGARNRQDAKFDIWNDQINIRKIAFLNDLQVPIHRKRGAKNDDQPVGEYDSESFRMNDSEFSSDAERTFTGHGRAQHL